MSSSYRQRQRIPGAYRTITSASLSTSPAAMNSSGTTAHLEDAVVAHL
jgi:hypothetical protein